MNNKLEVMKMGMKLYHGTSTMFDSFDTSLAGKRTRDNYCPDEFIDICNLGVFFLDSKEGQMEMYDKGYVAEIEISLDPKEDYGSFYYCHIDDMIRWQKIATTEEIIEEISEEHRIIKMDNGLGWEYIIFDQSIIESIKWN